MVMVRIRFSAWLVSGYAHVFVLVSVIVTLRITYSVCDGSRFPNIQGGPKKWAPT